jgi:hypothetical protein
MGKSIGIADRRVSANEGVVSMGVLVEIEIDDVGWGFTWEVNIGSEVDAGLAIVFVEGIFFHHSFTRIITTG